QRAASPLGEAALSLCTGPIRPEGRLGGPASNDAAPPIRHTAARQRRLSLSTAAGTTAPLQLPPRWGLSVRLMPNKETQERWRDAAVEHERGKIGDRTGSPGWE